MNTIDVPFEIKNVSAEGSFEGYGSVFGVLDSYDEIIAPGAFTDTLAEQRAKGRLPAMLWQHRSAEPIGAYTDMREDAVGLFVRGQLALSVQRAAEAFSLMKMRALTGLSIGFVTRDDSYDRVTGIRTLKKVDLWEVSPVTFPANDAARIQGVKAIELIDDITSAEQYLRDVGLSRREARAFISRMKGLSQCDAGEGEGVAEDIIAALKRRGRAIPA